ncbi:unnamed protein product [Gongylonema pulchrum]|uniref:Clathrin_bdg domain-containing protein n=1 Tax=Gongylonema pulchrum TaxID=637853 RepID=A0A183EWA6_9BILA|nr:unnamed protein product [Gongylonema pulchrum]
MSSEMPDAEVDEDETEDLNLDTDGLCNEVYGFDDSLLGTVPVVSPFVAEIYGFDDSLLGTVPVVSPFVAESGKAADENSQDVRMEEDSVPESSAVKPDLFGHYGYSFAANPSSAENAQESVDDVQMDEGFEVETRDASTASSLLNGTGVELASEAFESMPETQPPTIPTHQVNSCIAQMRLD